MGKGCRVTLAPGSCASELWGGLDRTQSDSAMSSALQSRANDRSGQWMESPRYQASRPWARAELLGKHRPEPRVLRV